MTKQEARTTIQTQLEVAYNQNFIWGYDIENLDGETTQFVVYLPIGVYSSKQILDLNDLLIQKYGCTTQINHISRTNHTAIQVII